MAEKKKEESAAGIPKDDALFEALGKTKKKKRRRIIVTVLVIVFVLVLAVAIGVSILKRRVREQFASLSGEVLSYEVSTGTISTVVSGSGTLTDVDLESVTVPNGVEITQVMVQNNDSVEEGDILATVDMASVMSVMAQLQGEIEELDEQISEAEDDEADSTVYAGVSGRVKMIYAETGDDVVDVMYEKGALALLSLDGYMAADVETDALSAGESVTVRLSDGEEISGTVESVSDGKATVLVADNGPGYEEAVTVIDQDGSELAGGELYIHSALRITGYAGTIAGISVDTNTEVSDTTILFTLEDTGYSANYKSLLNSRSQKEETLLELLRMKQDGALVSPVSGSVYSVDYSEDGEEEGAENVTAVATLSKDEKMSVSISVDESDILSLETGQEVDVLVSSVSEDTFAGTLTEINQTVSDSGSYSAVVELEKAEGMLSGMTASVSVKIEGVDNALLVPVEAVHQTSGSAYVYTGYDEASGEYSGRVDVVTGLENSTYVEIKSGLSAGDIVYYTEETSVFGGFGGGDIPGFDGGDMPDFGEDMPDMGGGMPDFGEDMPDMGGSMPDFGGSGMPGGN